jgi:hypothetical protein
LLVISGRALPNDEVDSRIKERRKEIFAGLDEIAEPVEVSDGWREFLQRKSGAGFVC